MPTVTRRAPHLARSRLRELVDEVDAARILIRRRACTHVRLKLRHQRVVADDAVAQHHDRPHDAASLHVGCRDGRRLGYRRVLDASLAGGQYGRQHRCEILEGA